MKSFSGRTVFLLVVAAAVLWLGYLASAVVTPLLVALLLAYVLDPVVRALERLRLSRSVASGLVVGLAFGAFVTIAALSANRLVEEADRFYADVVGEPTVDARSIGAAATALDAAPAPTDRHGPGVRLGEWEGRPVYYLDADGDAQFRPGYARAGFARLRRDLSKSEWSSRIVSHLQPTEDLGKLAAATAGQWLKAAAGAGSSAAGRALGLLTLVVLFPIYLYFSLAKLPWIYDVAVRHMPAGHRDQIVDILHKIHGTLSAFFRGRLILLVVRWVVLFGLFLGFHVPFAGVCALFGAIASLVPVLGSVAGAAVPLLLAVADGSTSGELLALAAAFVAFEVVEQYVLTPAILGKRVGLHALTILIATLVAADLLGIFGMVVAIPLAAVLKILAIEFVLPEVRRQAGLSAVERPAPEPPK